MTSPTDDEVRALVERTEYLADFYANYGAYRSDKKVEEGFRSAATMLSRLLAEREQLATVTRERDEVRHAIISMMFIPGVREAVEIVLADDCLEVWKAKATSAIAAEASLSTLRAENERLREALAVAAQDFDNLERGAARWERTFAGSLSAEARWRDAKLHCGACARRARAALGGE